MPRRDKAGSPALLLVAAPRERLSEAERLVGECGRTAALATWPDESAPCDRAVEQLALRYRDRARGLLVLVPRGLPLQQAAPGPVVHGLPVGALPTGGGEVSAMATRAPSQTSERLPRSFAVLAMCRDFYLEWGRRFVHALRQGYRSRATVHAWFADRTTRDELAWRIAGGPDLIVYVGHGRTRGWSGYRGLRWDHVTSVPIRRRAGAVLSLTCDTLKGEPGGRVPFGVRCVEGARCAAFVGAVSAVREDAMVGLADAFAAEFRSGRHPDLGALLASVDARVRAGGSADTLEAWSQFRVVGDPVVELGGNQSYGGGVSCYPVIDSEIGLAPAPTR